MKKPNSQATVVFLIDGEGKIGLARKKQVIHNDTGELSYSLLTYNGWGGKRESTDMSITHTAVRELAEEAGVSAKKEDLELVFRAYFHTKNKEGEGYSPFMDVSFYFLRRWTGVPTEGPEMGPPVFFDTESLPYHDMMPADMYLMKQAIAGICGVYEVTLHGKGNPPGITRLDEVL